MKNVKKIKKIVFIYKSKKICVFILLVKLINLLKITKNILKYYLKFKKTF
jgi:hypothetical protein